MQTITTGIKRRALVLSAVAISAGSVVLPRAEAFNTAGGGAGSVFVPIVPCRLFDTRANDAVGPRSAPLGPADTYLQSATGANGNCTIPAAAVGIAMNVTAVNGSAASYLTIWPADAPQPLASDLNWVAGAPPTPNTVDVKLSPDGTIRLFNFAGTVDVLADVVGYYADHDHDDRYYTKQQVDDAIAQLGSAATPTTTTPTTTPTTAPPAAVRQESYPASSFQPQNGTIANLDHGCTSSRSDVGEGRVPIELPVGASLVSIDVATLDGAGAFPYLVSVVRHDLGSFANVESTLDSNTHGGANAVVDDVFTPVGPLVLAPGESIDLGFTGFDGDHNAFCGAVVSYSVPD